MTVTAIRERTGGRKRLLLLVSSVAVCGIGGSVASAALGLATRLGTEVVVRQQLKPTGEVGGGKFGSGVAISGDGNTLLAGAPGRGGAVWIFTRTRTGWTQHGRLVAGPGTRPACFGMSVALSFDGSAALVGDPCSGGSRGAVWAFVRSGSNWKPAGRLSGRAASGAADFGAAVALSKSGDVALIGGPDDNGSTGAAWVFVRRGSSWKQEGPKLTGRGETEGGQLGLSVALSANGATALLGGPSDDHSRGAAWVFARSGSHWAEQGGKLTARAGAPDAEFGWSVALSGPGSIALIGSPSAGEWGQARIFARENGSWLERQRLALDGKGSYGLTGGFGVSVALSATGDTALVGSGLHNTNAAAAVLLTRSGSGWTLRGLTLSSARAIEAVNVALPSSGETPVLASPSAYSNAGGVWAFSFLNVTPPTISGAPHGPGENSRPGTLAA